MEKRGERACTCQALGRPGGWSFHKKEGSSQESVHQLGLWEVPQAVVQNPVPNPVPPITSVPGFRKLGSCSPGSPCRVTAHLRRASSP